MVADHLLKEFRRELHVMHVTLRSMESWSDNLMDDDRHEIAAGTSP